MGYRGNAFISVPRSELDSESNVGYCKLQIQRHLAYPQSSGLVLTDTLVPLCICHSIKCETRILHSR